MKCKHEEDGTFRFTTCKICGASAMKQLTCKNCGKDYCEVCTNKINEAVKKAFDKQ